MRRSTTALVFPALAVALAALGGCSDTTSGSGTPGRDDPTTPVETALPPEQQAELDAIQAQLDEVAGLDAAGFAERFAVPFTSDLGYDPLGATGLDLVQASPLALDADEQAALATRGFVISERTRYPTFVYGYNAIYAADLPVYVSADSILYAVHESYDAVLMTIETNALIPALARMLDGMRGALASGAASELPVQAQRDADLYVAVTRSLLAGSFQPPVSGGDATAAQALFAGATAAAGAMNVTLFGVPRDVDFSQFTPRGHYTESEDLKRYFRAMMWLGRLDLRILETQPDHSQLFHRRQIEAAYALRALMSDASLAEWKTLDTAIGAFAGEPDNMTLPELDGLLSDLGVSSSADLASQSDATIAQAVVNGGYGTQRISSHIMVNGLGEGTMPLSSTFLMLGQRYVLDSHVFSNVVYDRVQGGSVMRMMPDPLDVGFAALDNDHAGLLLDAELKTYSYAPDLASMRILADAHPKEFWEANLYNQWLITLRALSPGADVADPTAAGLPTVAGTEAWGRRMLNTQLASWAELRHDTVLYAKQSYTGGNSCEYPDAYVDPYPELYARLAGFASRGAALVAGLDFAGAPWASAIVAYFGQLEGIATTLGVMAQNQRTGTPHSAEHIAFINGMTFEQGCGSLAGFDGWYAKLFFNPTEAIELDPIIADVHTQPMDEMGTPVGRVLHVGTGLPRTLVVTVNSCTGPRAYIGVASSYYEHVTEQYQRLTDEEWTSVILTTPPADVPWMTDLVIR
jgi:hypothetical protein